jgi:hypothetical protein
MVNARVFFISEAASCSGSAGFNALVNMAHFFRLMHKALHHG